MRRQQVKSYLNICIGIAAGPGVIFLLPYATTAAVYASFTGFLALSQFLAAFAGGGLEIAVARRRANLGSAIAALVIVQAVVAVGEVALGSAVAAKELILAVGAAATANLVVIIQLYLLFSGDTSRYAQLSIIRASLMITAVVLSRIFGLSLVLGWFAAGVAASMVAVAFYRLFVKEAKKSSILVESINLIKEGMPLHVITTSATLPFLLDRLLAHNNFTPQFFAKYMVATSWALPMVYIGNAVQQYVTAKARITSTRQLIRVMRSLLVAQSLYCLAVAALLHVYTPPFFSNWGDFQAIWKYIILWQLPYCAIAFPLSSIIQAQMRAGDILNLMFWVAGFLTTFYVLYMVTLKLGYVINSPAHLAIISLAEVILIVLPKIVVAWRFLGKSGINPAAI